MKSGFFRRFSVCAVALALSLAVADAAGGSLNRPVAGSANSTLMSSFRWHAHKLMLAISSAPYAGDIDAGFVAHLISYLETTDRSAQEHDARLRRIADQIENGRTKEIEAMKKVSVPPRNAAKAPVR
jgi:hypothetical protein